MCARPDGFQDARVGHYSKFFRRSIKEWHSQLVKDLFVQRHGVNYFGIWTLFFLWKGVSLSPVEMILKDGSVLRLARRSLLKHNVAGSMVLCNQLRFVNMFPLEYILGFQLEMTKLCPFFDWLKFIYLICHSVTEQTFIVIGYVVGSGLDVGTIRLARLLLPQETQSTGRSNVTSRKLQNNLWSALAKRSSLSSRPIY